MKNVFSNGVNKGVAAAPPRRGIGRLLAVFLCALLSASPATLKAENESAFDVGPWVAALDKIEKGLSVHSSDRDLGEWLKQGDKTHEQAAACIEQTGRILKKIQDDIALLGEKISGEAAEVTSKRKSLQQNASALEKTASSCKLLLLRSDDLSKKIKGVQQNRLAARLFAQGSTLLDLLKIGWDEPALWYGSTKVFVVENSGLGQLSRNQKLWLLLLIIGVPAATVFAIRRLDGPLELGPHGNTVAAYLGSTLLQLLARYAPYLLTTASVAAYIYVVLPQAPLPFISVVAYGLPVYFLLIVLVQLFVSSRAAAADVLPLPAEQATALNRWVRILVSLSFLGYLLFSTILVQSLPESALLLARAMFAAVLIVNLIRVTWLLGYFPRLQGFAWLRPLFAIVLLASLAAEWLGYRNLSTFMLRGVMGTLLLLGVVWLVRRLIFEFFDGLNEAQRLWAKRLRLLLGQRPNAAIPGLAWLQLLLELLVWSMALLGLLSIWGMSESGFRQLYALMISGFTIGSLNVIPARILLAALVLGVMLFINGWLRAQLERHWMASKRMERGTREAMVTLSGYVGIMLAVLISLIAAGVEFGNLAIIAGALSVGIGFGLQNIVNNFVSGLILLFERPVKTGDWVVVGDTEGYVRRISIRSTQIQTFDRADVIVPNSDLISSQVTNWMLYDNYGRVKVPVGVAYGSDTEKVKQILLDLANAHPLIVTDGSVPEPKVLFLSFGDSSLDFELRAHVSNVDNRLNVLSELNFAIDKAFREQGIEIPFPQRDIHFRSGKVMIDRDDG